MRLDFNVLWVDDQPAFIDAQIKSIARRMEEEGFQFNALLCKSLEDVRQLIAEDVFTDEVDLILVDWDLGGGVYGEEAIAAIRDVVRYKDVVFYSALKPADELRALASDRGLEGIYCANREGLVDEVLGVFESLVKKVLDLDHTRGIVMGATSDIDHMVHECLASIHDRLDEAGKKEMLQEALARIDDKVKDLTKRAEKLQGATSLAALLEAHVIFTANDRLRMLSQTLEKDAFKEHGAARTAVASYIKSVVRGRNELGHLVLVPAGKPAALVTIEGKEIGLAEMRELRRLILGLRSEFRDLLAALKA